MQILKRRFACRANHITALAFALGASGVAMQASATSVVGTLGNFDAVNDTGSTAHGFEIDLEGISSRDVTDTFGGAGRGFPTTVERYGAPTIKDVTFANGASGVAIVYQSSFNNQNNSWVVGTPSGVYSTPGESCWTGGGSGYGSGTPCDHFGVGTRKTPTKTTYTWLTETAPNSPILNGVAANIPAPIQVVTPQPPPPPPPPNVPPPPPPPPVVMGVVEGVEPQNGFQFGVPEWVKVFTIQYDHPVGLYQLVGGAGGVVPKGASEVETEWQLLQTEVGNPAAGVLEKGGAADKGSESVLRRYEFYKYTGQYEGADGTPTYIYDGTQALSDIAFTDGPNANVGAFIGAQNLAVNLNGVYAPGAVPEASTWFMMILGFAGLGAAGLWRRPASAKA